ncbi:uncharacterized protein LOC141554616 isoform X1 [Sminthopsis crassicaudata]|uniref:uncharacterized protein LOC141554616 isoform X1 n=1 Tax=Sminthopsis crassicaudata TaxID=9301 RepID=UPI003D68D95A
MSKPLRRKHCTHLNYYFVRKGTGGSEEGESLCYTLLLSFSTRQAQTQAAATPHQWTTSWGSWGPDWAGLGRAEQGPWAGRADNSSSAPADRPARLSLRPPGRLLLGRAAPTLPRQGTDGLAPNSLGPTALHPHCRGKRRRCSTALTTRGSYPRRMEGPGFHPTSDPVHVGRHVRPPARRARARAGAGAGAGAGARAGAGAGARAEPRPPPRPLLPQTPPPSQLAAAVNAAAAVYTAAAAVAAAAAAVAAAAAAASSAASTEGRGKGSGAG